MAHSDVAFDVKCGRSGEPERFHVGEHLGLEHLAFAPRSSKTTDQLVVDGAPENTECVKCVTLQRGLPSKTTLFFFSTNKFFRKNASDFNTDGSLKN